MKNDFEAKDDAGDQQKKPCRLNEENTAGKLGIERYHRRRDKDATKCVKESHWKASNGYDQRPAET